MFAIFHFRAIKSKILWYKMVYANTNAVMGNGLIVG